MSTGSLLDLLAGRIARDDSANVIRVTEKEGMLDRIRSRMVPEENNHILIYVDLDGNESELVVAMFPDAHIYLAKELCHQVPVCYRASVPGRCPDSEPPDSCSAARKSRPPEHHTED